MNATTAIITGASSGIGRTIAECLTGQGVGAGLLGRDPGRLADAARATGAVAAETADVTDLPALTAASDRLRDALGHVDIVVAAAGGTGHAAIEDEPTRAAAAWREIIDRNLTGTFHTALALARHITRPGGRLITISSIAAATGGSTGALAYAAAKAGTDGLTRALSSELGPQGIAVNAIAPGYIAETRFFGDGDQTDRERLFSERIPSGRVGRPHDVAALVGFLCSADADHIRGQVRHINGGQHYAG